MIVRTETINFRTAGHGDVRDITPAVSETIRRQRFTAGTANGFLIVVHISIDDYRIRVRLCRRFAPLLRRDC